MGFSHGIFRDGRTKSESVTHVCHVFTENDAAHQKGSGCSVSKNPLLQGGKMLLPKANRTRLGPFLANC